MKHEEYYMLSPTSRTQGQAVAEFLAFGWRGDGYPIGIAWIVEQKPCLRKFTELTPAQKRKIAKRFPAICVGDYPC